MIPYSRFLFAACFAVCPLFSASLLGSPPTANPVAAHYTSDVGYPAWTDHIAWDNVLDMSAFGDPGQSDFEKFEEARDQLHAEGGGVLYYPAGTYDFSDAPMDGPDGRGLMLKSGVVIRGAAPTSDADASDGSLVLPTRFEFGFTSRTGTGPTPTGQTPRDWNIIGLQPDTASGEALADVDNVGIVHVHLVGASVFFGFQLDWDGTTTYADSGAWKSGLVKDAWADRVANGQFPLDYFAGSGSRSYVGAGSGRLVFACILQDSAPVNNVYREGRADPMNFGETGYWLQKFGARIQVYGSNAMIANNLLPQSTRGFLYDQTVGDNPSQSGNTGDWNNQTKTIFYNYNYVTGIDLNKELLNPFIDKATGYFEPHAVVRDNWVYNHGRKGYNLSGQWVEIRNNTNQRDYLGTTVPAGSGPASGESYYLTLDGYVQAKPGGSGSISDTLSRAFDLGGGPLWIHQNKYGGAYGSTHSDGNDGEGILCQAHGGTDLYSWAVTYNNGQSGYMAGYDVDHYGSLFGWNTTVGNTGNVKDGTMSDSAVVNNSGGSVATTDPNALTSDPGDPAVAPGNVTATVNGDVVEITWTDGDDRETGFRVERSVDNGPWETIAYRPRRQQKVANNPAAWHDLMAPRALPLRYRVRATNWNDDSTAVSESTDPVTIPSLQNSGPIAVDPDSLTPQDPSWETGYQDRVADLVNADSWSIGSGRGDPDVGKRDWPGLLAEMWKDRDNDSTLQNWIDGKGMELINSQYAGSFYKPFSVPGYNMFYFHFKDYSPTVGLSPSQESDARNINWDYLTREDNRMDPIYGQTEFNSENFNWMARLGGLQWAFELPDADLGTYQYNWQAGQPKGMSRDYFPNYMDNWTRALFNAGRVEWNSVNYWGYTLHPVLTLLEHPPHDPANPGYQNKVRRQARAGADWLLLEAALHYLDGFNGGADTRAKTKPHLPFAGSVWPSAYLYFAEEGHMPTYDLADAQNALSRNLVGWFPWSGYRPLNVIKSIAQRDFDLPVEIQSAKPFYHLDHDNYAPWQGEGTYAEWKADKAAAEQDHRTGFRFEFESIYMDHNYLLSSLATYRPDGNIGTFSEQNLFRLVVQGTDAGALQVIGNTGDTTGNPAGRDPHEQMGQYGNVVMRVSKNPSAFENMLWFGIPKVATREWDGNRLFVNMGNGVYFAVLPLGSPATSDQEHPDNKGGHQQYRWDYNANELAAVVMEVGTVADHGSFAAFKAAFDGLALTSPATDEVEYTATDGKHLRMQWTGVVNDYPMTERGGRILSTAGTIPRTWRDGVEVDYESWNAYEVVQGEPIVHQEWGSGRLTMAAGGETVQIAVDPQTAEVTYYSGEGQPALPVVSIEEFATEGIESIAAPLRYRIAADPAPSADLTVALALTGAADWNDFTTAPPLHGQSLILPGGQDSVELVLTPVKDNQPEGSESLSLAIAPSPNYQIGTPAEATGILHDHTAGVRSWQQNHFSAAEIAAGLAAPEADAELNPDGIPNLMEYAFAMDPRTSDPHLARIHFSTTEDNGQPHLSLVFRRNPDATDINFQIQTSRDMTGFSWLDETPALQQPAGTAPDGTPLQEFQIPLSGDSRVFARLLLQPLSD